MSAQIPELKPIVLSTPEGLEVEVLTFGATIKSINVLRQSVALEYSDPTNYLVNPFYLGSTIGRYANRIANGRFSLNNQVYEISKGASQHALHGGLQGFSHRNWLCSEHSKTHCVLSLTSEHNEGGFPGRLNVDVCVRVEKLAIEILYTAVSSHDTVISLTNHTYFNLDKNKSSINSHLLQIDADSFLAVTPTGIPTGETLAVADTSFDFRTLKQVMPLSNEQDSQLGRVNGYDHFFILNQPHLLSKPAARLVSTQSNIGLDIYTNQPGIQFYSGNFLDKPFQARAALCLEAQHWPDAPNQEHFPTPILLAGERYQKTIRYEFFETKNKPDVVL